MNNQEWEEYLNSSFNTPQPEENEEERTHTISVTINEKVTVTFDIRDIPLLVDNALVGLQIIADATEEGEF